MIRDNKINKQIGVIADGNKWITEDSKRRGKRKSVWKYSSLKTYRKNALYFDPAYMLTFNFCNNMHASHFTEEQCNKYLKKVNNLFNTIKSFQKELKYKDVSYLACLEGGHFFKSYVIPYHYHIMIDGVDDYFLGHLRLNYTEEELHFTTPLDTVEDKKTIIDYTCKTKTKEGKRVKILDIPPYWKGEKFLQNQFKYNLKTKKSFNESELKVIDSSDLKVAYNCVYDGKDKKTDIYRKGDTGTGRTYTLDTNKRIYTPPARLVLPDDVPYEVAGLLD